MIESRGFYVSHKEVDEIVEKMDKNKDGRVSFAEVSYRSESAHHLLMNIDFQIQLSLS
jgi:Ca2+-binding EF-hand superfamily protein